MLRSTHEKGEDRPRIAQRSQHERDKRPKSVTLHEEFYVCRYSVEYAWPWLLSVVPGG